MKNSFFEDYCIDYIEIYTPMAKSFAYWHVKALGFTIVAYYDYETGNLGKSSYLLKSGDICLVLTSTYPPYNNYDAEVNDFIAKNYCGVKRIALRVNSIHDAFKYCITNGAIPIKLPYELTDENGIIQEAIIKLYDNNEILLINRNSYKGVFKPGYTSTGNEISHNNTVLLSVDHIASELRMNQIDFWTNYLTNTIGTNLVQNFGNNENNISGMILNINQSFDKKLTLVMAEPSVASNNSKIYNNVEKFGAGIHHLAFSTDNIVSTIVKLQEENVDFVKFPSSYYKLLRENEEFDKFDIDELEEFGILIDKEGETYLLQKFLKPVSDRPFFIYEIIQRVNGYSGFALKNINVLKRAEELEIQKLI